MGTCKYMRAVELIVEDINWQYDIQLDAEYVERIKRLICGPLCSGRCRPENIE